MDLLFVSEIVGLGILAGTLGSLVGIGGGVLLVPLLSAGLGIPIHQAIGASLLGVIATSISASNSYLQARLTNIRLALTLEVATAAGAILGGVTAVMLSRQVLGLVFSIVLILVGLSMLWRSHDQLAAHQEEDGGSAVFGGRFHDPYLRRDVEYRVRRLPLGLGVSFAAGAVSGLLGIGGGVIKVPAMVLGMGIPMRAAAATSNLMIGITAVASGYIYFSHGFINPLVAAPTILGVFAGSAIGTRVSSRLRGSLLEVTLAVILLLLSVYLTLSVLGEGGGR